jgi:ATP synthase F1 gamma subunit
MSLIKEQRDRIRDISSVQYITGTLRDISAGELKKLREKFERNISFGKELREVFHTVWWIAEKMGKTELRGGNPKILYVAYTTNHHFYGSLNEDVVRQCLLSTEPHDHCLIVGDTGRSLWNGMEKKRLKSEFLSFKDDTPEKEEVRDFLKKVESYERVYIFYPSFINVFQQKVKMLDISFKPKKGQGPKGDEDVLSYILEPDVEGMLVFFNSQVRYALFEQLLLETELSRVSARLVKMDSADQNAEVRLKAERGLLRRAHASLSSRRMLETLLGFIQWNTHKKHIVQ